MNFFITGYPKAGTTSLYGYLNSHPGVFLPALKEPHYFTEDYPGAREVTTEDDYLALYRDAEPGQLRGDASASVIHSEVALDRILSGYPDAKFIVLVREPVAAVRSFHGELLHNLNEDEEVFERAWRLQSDRAEGRRIPATCREPRFLQYEQIFRYRDQLPAFFDKVPADQRLVLVFEEFFLPIRDRVTGRCWASWDWKTMAAPSSGRRIARAVTGFAGSWRRIGSWLMATARCIAD